MLGATVCSVPTITTCPPVCLDCKAMVQPFLVELRFQLSLLGAHNQNSIQRCTHGGCCRNAICRVPIAWLAISWEHMPSCRGCSLSQRLALFDTCSDEYSAALACMCAGTHLQTLHVCYLAPYTFWHMRPPVRDTPPPCASSTHLFSGKVQALQAATSINDRLMMQQCNGQAAGKMTRC